MIWICAGNGVDNTAIFSYCWAALTQSQGLFCSSHHPVSDWAAGAQEAGRRHSQDSWPQLTKGITHALWCLAQQQI